MLTSFDTNQNAISGTPKAEKVTQEVGALREIMGLYYIDSQFDTEQGDLLKGCFSYSSG